MAALFLPSAKLIATLGVFHFGRLGAAFLHLSLPWKWLG